MKSQACEPCAKRKVRCDRAEPSCSNCKRRKHDHCVYPDVSPFERIKALEEQIRVLGGDPSSEEVEKPLQDTSYIKDIRNTAETPVILQEEGRSVYLESEGWQAWINSARLQGATKPSESNAHRSIHSSGKHLPHAFAGSPWRSHSSRAVALTETPVPTHAVKLWNVFMQRVEPTNKILFEWTLKRFRTALTDFEGWKRLSESEHALILSACLFGVVALSKEECAQDFGEPRWSLLVDFRTRCEDSLMRMNLLAIEDITVLKALCLYMKAGIDTLSTHSLWSLMGLASRSAEQLGIHRDGQLLGLSSSDTEERRRLWWQLQHIELILAIKSGVTPLTFTADWDSKLPLNIEDSDIADVASKAMPAERFGLTSQSYSLFTYWIISQQRIFRQKRLNQPRPVDRSLLGPLTDIMINELEAGLNKNFLQYCDPIKPLHALIQISARAIVCILRLRKLHEMRISDPNHLDEKSQGEYFSTCLQSLNYVAATFSQPSLKCYRWLAESTFPWHALIGVLLDMSQLTDTIKIKEAWALLTDLYGVAAFLMDLDDDRRRSHAARLVMATWEVCQNKPGLGLTEKPAFIATLEDCISSLGQSGDVCEEAHKAQGEPQPTELEFWPNQNDLGELNFNFADIDWSFWESIS